MALSPELTINEQDLDALVKKYHLEPIVRHMSREAFVRSIGVPEFLGTYSQVSQVILLDATKPHTLLAPIFGEEAVKYRNTKPLFRPLEDGDLDLYNIPANYISPKTLHNLRKEGIHTVKHLSEQPLPLLIARDYISSTLALRLTLSLQIYNLRPADIDLP